MKKTLSVIHQNKQYPLEPINTRKKVYSYTLTKYSSIHPVEKKNVLTPQNVSNYNLCQLNPFNIDDELINNSEIDTDFFNTFLQ